MVDMEERWVRAVWDTGSDDDMMNLMVCVSMADEMTDL